MRTAPAVSMLIACDQSERLGEQECPDWRRSHEGLRVIYSSIMILPRLQTSELRLRRVASWDYLQQLGLLGRAAYPDRLAVRCLDGLDGPVASLLLSKISVDQRMLLVSALHILRFLNVVRNLASSPFRPPDLVFMGEDIAHRPLLGVQRVSVEDVNDDWRHCFLRDRECAGSNVDGERPCTMTYLSRNSGQRRSVLRQDGSFEVGICPCCKVVCRKLTALCLYRQSIGSQ
jgi:hypothetical protein